MGNTSNGGNAQLKKRVGKRVVLWCECYIYEGELVEVDGTSAVLKDAGVVYETGELNAKNYKDRQQLPGEHWCVSLAKIESFGDSKQG